MSRTRFVLTLLLGAVAAALPPTSAHAGWYHVQSCHPDGVAPGWVTSDVAHTTAYIDCGSASTSAGLRARNVIDGKYAPGFSAAAVSIGAPAGTHFDWMSFDADLTADLGWSAGVYDFQNRRWAWCGRSCFTSFGWRRFEIPLRSTTVGAMVMCAESRCGPDNKAFGSLGLRNVTLRVQDPVAPTLQLRGGTLLSGRWLRGVHTLDATTSDNTGVRALQLLVDGRVHDRGDATCDYRRVTPCAPTINGVLSANLNGVSDGTHQLRVVATDSASNATQRLSTIRVDSTAPDRVSELAAEPSGWTSKTTFRVTWNNPSAGPGSPIVAAFTQLCADACQPPQRHSRTDVEALDITVPSAGRWTARIWLEDAAGNQSPSMAQEIELLADTAAPTVRLLDRSANEPGALYVEATDALSGIATTELELRRSHDLVWHSIPVSPTERGFVGIVDDELLPAGRYQVRARATDRARNEQTAAGQSLDLPFRLQTLLTVGRPKRVKAQGIGGEKFRQILVKRPTAPYGRSIHLTGRLTSPGRNPLVDRDIDVAELLPNAGAVWRPIATVRTDQRGRFRFKALPGPSRQLRFRYAGTPTVRGQSSLVKLRVRAASTLRVSRKKVVNGEAVTFRGTVQGEIPPAGKLLQLQVFSRRAWLTFATPRANQRGKWRHDYRFTATRGITRYRFRVRLPRETGFPYAAGVSRPVPVKVVGL
jgi:hypothetical protein